MRGGRSRRWPGGHGDGHYAGARRTFRRGDREVALRAAAHRRDVAALCAAAARGAGGVGGFPCSRASAFARRSFGLGRRGVVPDSLYLQSLWAGLASRSPATRSNVGSRGKASRGHTGLRITGYFVPAAWWRWLADRVHIQWTAASTPLGVLNRRDGTRSGAGAPARGQTTQCRSVGWTRQRARRAFARKRLP